ncbi:MAG: SpoVR family protein [Halobacteriales archaeon]|nr:SpoVR family protein [Halobacteriales archaeon]
MKYELEKRKEADELREVAREARALAEKLGLEPYDVNYWVVDHDEINRAVAYGGFQTRYPHWRWGMNYDKQSKQDRFTQARIYELVVNDDPCHAYLQVSNDLADQKAVITHVEAHADFFANNRWFREFTEGFDSAATLARHAESIQGYMSDPDVDREDVEEWIDNVLCLEDNIDQHGTYGVSAGEEDDLAEKLEELDLSDEVKQEVFDEEWLEKQTEDGDGPAVPEKPEKDILAFLADHGKAYDDETGKAVEYDDWQKDVIEILRREAYYFAPQKMTKIMNEGWSALWESMMMGNERFAGDDEILTYADHQAKVLSSGGLNPYKLGKELWEYVENTTNRTEVVGRLLRVEGVTPDSFHDRVEFDAVQDALQPTYPLGDVREETLEDLRRLDTKVDHDALEAALSGEIDVSRNPWKVLNYEGLAERNFSLTRPQNRGFIQRVSRDDLEETYRYLFDTDRYMSVDEALDEVDYTVGWDRMREIRATHNDVTFIDEFLTEEFVRDNDYFVYEHSHATGNFHVSSKEYEDVKKKLLLQFTNFGKPTILVKDANYDNAGELLLVHQYNGVVLNTEKARRTLERVHALWGRPVNLKTIKKEVDDNVMKMARRRGKEPEPNEKGIMLRYDGEGFETRELDDDEVEEIRATSLDYDTKPDDWL